MMQVQLFGGPRDGCVIDIEMPAFDQIAQDGNETLNYAIRPITFYIGVYQKPRTRPRSEESKLLICDCGVENVVYEGTPCSICKKIGVLK